MDASKTDISVCALFGSPDRDGASARLHESFLSCLSGVRVERFHVYSLNIRPCTGCLACADGKKCSIDDDMNLIYDALSRCSHISFSYPLYFSSMPGPLKNLIDRCNLLWMRRKMGLAAPTGQKGLVIATAGSVYRDMFNPSMTVVSHLMNSFGGKLDRERSFCIPGLDTPEGRDAYERLCFDRSELVRRAASFLETDAKKI